MESARPALAGKPTSVWMDTAPHTTYPAQPHDVSVDVCVIGGGITGLTAAALLKHAGLTVAVCELNRVAAGVTGYTTAKITALHGLIYDQITSSFGSEGARAYAEANQAGLELIARWVGERSIDCDFRRRPAFTYAESFRDARKIEKEVEAARAAGLRAEYVKQVDLPWEVAGAIRLDDQAEFHPRRYLLDVAGTIDGQGSYIFERTRATGVDEGSPCRVRTEHGEVIAEQVILASHYPTLDRGLFFARLSPERSYALGARIRGDVPQGMFLSTESPSHSVRAHPLADGELVIIGGESHKTGQGGDTLERYGALEDWARERFEVETIDYRWSAQDCMPADGIPYVGALTPASKRVFTATGYRKWGMTNGTAAAIMLADRVVGRDNPWAEVFDSNRFKPVASAPKLLKENVNVGLHFFADRLSPPDVRSLDELGAGEGGIVSHEGEKVAAYRDEEGGLHAVSPICTHLYCQVKFNAGERSWDCPCHGSRYDMDGRVLEGPAVNDLERREIRAPEPG
jgi:glycine/D-amino acid oxidase-like deaminating enzyme/nitrite reductase/ring-hydroxylating ferredoxin subunit